MLIAFSGAQNLYFNFFFVSVLPFLALQSFPRHYLCHLVYPVCMRRPWHLLPGDLHNYYSF